MKAEELVKNIVKLDAAAFIGLAVMLKVPLYSGDSKEPRSFEDILNDVGRAYGKLSRRQKRNLDIVLRQAAKNGGELNGASTKNLKG